MCVYLCTHVCMYNILAATTTWTCTLVSTHTTTHTRMHLVKLWHIVMPLFIVILHASKCVSPFALNICGFSLCCGFSRQFSFVVLQIFVYKEINANRSMYVYIIAYFFQYLNVLVCWSSNRVCQPWRWRKYKFSTGCPDCLHFCQSLRVFVFSPHSTTIFHLSFRSKENRNIFHCLSKSWNSIRVFTICFNVSQCKKS